MAGKEALVRANRAKSDEFYTQLSDVEAELWHYRDRFRGKVDAVRPSDHAGDQCRDLHLRVAATRPGHSEALVHKVVQTGAFSDLQDRRKVSARHEVGLIEERGDAMRDSHSRFRSLNKIESPAITGHLGFKARASSHDYRWIRD